MDTLYICSELGCTHTHRRKAGGIYLANVPVHHRVTVSMIPLANPLKQRPGVA